VVRHRFGFDSEWVFDHDDGARLADQARLAPELLIHRAAAFERGVDADDIKRRLARGDWQVIRRGVYARSLSFAALTAQEQHCLRVPPP
jgi:hypothetical protein